MMFATREQIEDLKKEISEIKNLVLELAKNKTTENLKEYTLNETAKLLGISSATLRFKVETGEIEAIPEPRANARNGVTYKFTNKMIKDYQNKRIISIATRTSIDVDKFIEDTINEFQREKGFDGKTP